MASYKSIADRLTCRQVLNIMVILGFMLNYMLRVNLTIAIVAMVEQNKSSSNHKDCPISSYENANETSANESIMAVNGTRDNSTLTSPAKITQEELQQTKYPWNEHQVNLILGSFFWGYICTELPGGRLAEVVGARRVFGYSMLVSSAITLLTPFSASLGHPAVVALRAVLGFMLGATWPAIQPMTAHWIPPMERSKFVSNMMASSLGAAITMPICGFLIASLGWESVFYVTGGIGLAWSAAWFFLIYDSPSQHPRISEEERQYIEDAIGTSSTTRRLSVPWRAIITSGPVWAIIITHGCSVFGYFTVVNQLPTYMKYILNFNIKENGLLSSLPYLGKYIFALATSALADYLRRTNKLSVTAIRKIFTTFAVMSPGLLMIIQANFGFDRVISVTIFTVALTVNGAVTAGYLGNGLDIAPNFSGTIFGMANTLSSLGGFLSAFMVGQLTNCNQVYSQWRIIFWILVGTYCGGSLVFALLGSGEIQPWNSPDFREAKQEASPENGVHPAERVPLKERTVTR